MFEFKAQFIEGDRVVRLPESWSELTFDQYVNLVNNDDKEWLTRLIVLTGIEDIGKLPVHAIELFTSIISFLADVKPLNDANVVPEKYQDFKYSSSVEFTWHQEVLIEFKKWSDHYEVDKAETPEQKDILMRKVQMSSAAKLVEVCTRFRTTDERVIPGMKINNDPVLEVIGMVNFFLHSSIIYSNGTAN